MHGAVPLKLIVGLGNPGSKYAQTRHNAGFWFVEQLAERYQGRFLKEPKFSAELARITVAGHALWLLKPNTFMNRSGLSVGQFLKFYKLNLEQILVAHDELDLEPGVVRLKQGGGHGGHNGLRDIIAQVGKEFWRLRIGIGHPGHRDQVVDYVLNRPSKSEEALIHSAIERAIENLPTILESGFEQSMNQLHRR